MTDSLSTIQFPKGVLFDLDGTLLDNSEVVVDAYYTGLQELGYPLKSRSEIASLAGKNTHDTALALGVDKADTKLMDAWFWQYFDNYCSSLSSPPVTLQGAKSIISFLSLSKVVMGVVTSNSAQNADLLLTQAGFRLPFSTIVGKEHTDNHKPHPAPIYHALEKLDLEKDKSVWMIGDTTSDIGAAKAAGIYSIGIPQSHTKLSVEQSNPDQLFESLNDLEIYLRSL